MTAAQTPHPRAKRSTTPSPAPKADVPTTANGATTVDASAEKATAESAKTPDSAGAGAMRAGSASTAGAGGTTRRTRSGTSGQGGALAAGAARASGERRRRTGTPLLGVEPVEVSAARRRVVEQGVVGTEPVRDAASADHPSPDRPAIDEPAAKPPAADVSVPAADATTDRETAPGARPEAAERPEPAPGAGTEAPPETPALARPSRAAIRAKRRTASSAEPTRLHAVPSAQEVERETSGVAEEGGRHTTPGEDTEPTVERAVSASLEAAEFSSEARPGPAEFVELAINVIRAAATSSGLPAEDVERQVAETIAYLRRRLSGDYLVDEFGFDEDYTLHVHLPLLRPLYRKWFRVEVRGIENIPTVGGALVVGNHSGTVAMDSLMTQVAVYDEHPANRHLRMLGADLVFQMPFVGTMARRSGSTLAANTDAERLLRSGELVGVWPEGFKGVGKPFSERYKLQRFGRGGFVSAALRAGVPIVPVSIVGAEEIYPMIGNMPAVARLLGVPYAPITPTFPWLGPLGIIPLPSKWLIEFGPPIETTSFGPDAADDPMLVFDLTDQVRETIQQTLYSLLMQRKSVFL